MDGIHPGILFVLGIGVFGGVMGARLFQLLRIPQVVGYIAIGVLIGQSGLRLVTAGDVDSYRVLNLFALGIIGFLVGGELHGSTFRKHGRQFLGILLGEGLGAFVLVGVGAAAVVHVVTGSLAVAVASGIVFGAIASATDPASTLDVLREYRSRGIMTTTVIATVALDDALAMTLYGLGTALAGILTGGSWSVPSAALKIGVELFGSLALGAAAGVLLHFIHRYLTRPDRSLAVAIGTILVVIATAAALQMDVILATMLMGVVLANSTPQRSRELFAVVRSFAEPIYVIFFVLVGARLGLSSMPGWLWAIVGLYVLGRTAGKMGGAFLGARLTGADRVVERYSGLGLFAQGGVAVGLSIMAAQHLGTIPVAENLTLADMIIFAITATTLIVQFVGPPMIKLAARLAGEIGRDVTEEDVLVSMSVGDVMTRDVLPIVEEEPLSRILNIFSTHDHLVYPVVGAGGGIVGLVTLEGIKNLITSTDTWHWLVAADVMLPVRDTVAAATPLKAALETMRQVGKEQIAVLAGNGDRKPVGILDSRKVRIALDEEILRRRHPEKRGQEPFPRI